MWIHCWFDDWLASLMVDQYPAHINERVGGGPGVVVSTAAFHASVRGSFPTLGVLQERIVSSPSTRKTQYCGELL